MTNEIQAKVAEVLDDTRIALNVGGNSGVEIGDEVVLWRVVTVTDPETGQSLGDARVPRIRMRVEEVHDRFSLAGTIAPSAFNFAVSRRPRISNADLRNSDAVKISVGDEVTVSVTTAQDIL